MGRVGAADPPGLLPKGCSVCSRFRWAPGLILAFIRPLISEAQQAWTSCCLGTAEVIRTHQRPLRGSQCRGEPRPPPWAGRRVCSSWAIARGHCQEALCQAPCSSPHLSQPRATVLIPMYFLNGSLRLSQAGGASGGAPHPHLSRFIPPTSSLTLGVAT